MDFWKASGVIPPLVSHSILRLKRNATACCVPDCLGIVLQVDCAAGYSKFHAIVTITCKFFNLRRSAAHTSQRFQAPGAWHGACNMEPPEARRLRRRRGRQIMTTQEMQAAID